MQFGQMKRWHFTAKLTTESSAVMCDGLIKQEDYLPVICTCIIYNLLKKTKTSITFHISLIETAGSNCDSISWHRGTQQPTQVTNSSKCNHKSSGNSCLLRLTDGNGADAAMIWGLPCCLGLVRFWERQTLYLCITALAPRFQNESTYTKQSQTSLQRVSCISILLWKSSPHIIFLHIEGISNLLHAL